MKYIEKYLKDIIKVKPLGKLTTEEDELDGISGEMVYIDGKCSNIFISHIDYANWLEKQGNKDSQVKLPTFTFDDILALQCCMETVRKVQNDKDLYEKLNNLHGRIYDAYYLERQCEQNPYSGASFKYNDHAWGMCARDGGVEILMDGNLKAFISLDKSFIYPISSQSALEAVKEEKIDNQTCVKPADKFKPKFKVGDWIISTLPGIKYPHLITDIRDGYYIFGEDDDHAHIASNDDVLKLWTIQDAKDGDVLVSRSPFIYGKQCPYGGLNWCNNKFIKASNFIFTDSPVHPATKEQRDFLFQKMKEAGYTFDFKNKELKKIKNDIEISFGAKDSELQEATYFIPKGFHAEIDDDKVVIKKGEKPTAWSEEDERRLNFCLNILRPKTLFGSTEITNIDTINTKWLKSLKERIGG